MSTLGNFLWLLCGGLLMALLYFIAGLVLCCTLIGIPFGLQLFKIGSLALHPFGADVRMLKDDGCITLVFNLCWLMLGWWEIALLHVVLAALCALTIVGIPFAKAHLRLARLSCLPFGSRRG